MTDPAVHTSHPAIIKRLRRADGHLRKIIGMIEDGRSCLDIAQQLQAVESAVNAAKKTLIHDHLDHCLDEALDPASGDGRSVIDSFKEITRYL